MGFRQPRLLRAVEILDLDILVLLDLGRISWIFEYSKADQSPQDAHARGLWQSCHKRHYLRSPELSYACLSSRRQLAPFPAMKLRQIFGHPNRSKSSPERKHTPWFASPLESSTSPTPRSVLRSNLAFDKTGSGPRDPRLPPLRSHQGSSTVELFYDLFFVANLATFTTNHDIVDGKSLKKLRGFLHASMVHVVSDLSVRCAICLRVYLRPSV